LLIKRLSILPSSEQNMFLNHAVKMRNTCLTVGSLVATMLLLPLVSAAVQAAEVQVLKNTTPKRILFVGNSYFYYNDSLHNHVRRIVDELNPGVAEGLQYKSATIGGAALWHHAINNLLAPGKIGVDKPFDLVIFQGGSAEVLSDKRREIFYKTAKFYTEKARETGAEVAFYMTHAYVPPHNRAKPNMIDTISRSYIEVGDKNNALVIPVGLAFDRAYKARPDIQLHKSFDGSHPSMLGTYLAACVVYLSVYGGSIDGLTYTYFGEVDEADAQFLQQTATETVSDFFERK
jgi:hypothetical protein